MLYWIRRSVQTKFKSLKQAVRLTTWRAQRRLLSKSKLARTSQCVHTTSKSTICFDKAVIIPSLPGVSQAQLPDPPCPHLLLCNQVPTDAEAELILDAITQAQEEAARLTATFSQRRNTESQSKDDHDHAQEEAARLTATFSQRRNTESQSKDDHDHGGQTSHAWKLAMTHKIDQANIFIRQHQGLLSAIRQLPAEILQEIFLHVAHCHLNHHDLQWRLDLNEHPSLALSQACGSWRTIALNMPPLWGHLPTIRLSRSLMTTRLQMQYLHELLRRSTGTLLDLCIDATHFYPVQADKHHHPTVELLCQHAELWETAAIKLNVCVLGGLRSIKGRLTALKSLTLSASIPPLMLPPDSIDFFEEAPQLTFVHIATPFPQEIPFPFAQLKHYKERFNFEELQITRAMRSPVLETLTMIVLTDEFAFPTLTLPCLVQLHAEFPYRLRFNHANVGCFDNLTLPSIQDIRIITREKNMAPTLWRMLKNSSPCLALKTLAICFESIDPGQLTSLLQLAPALVHLSATLQLNSEIDIRNLAGAGLSGRPHPPLVPLLETCEFFHDDDNPADVSIALNTLASFRCEPQAPPQSLETFASNINLPLILPFEGPWPIRHLKSLSISFSGPESPRLQTQHRRLEDWSFTVTSFDLGILRDALVAKLPDLLYHGYHEQGGIRSRSENDKVGKILAGIDAIRVDHARDIYASDALYALKSIATCQCPGTKNGALARKILDKWSSITEDPDALKHRHWARQGDRSLVYIPNDSDGVNSDRRAGVSVLAPDLAASSPSAV
ncbi:hypothetical protein CVT25_013026 [Psilocybe cyanescens]|uniref:F-box domain-containing protein n=1 Tax=Psilocybe cyanescens TaxID=93625 RepID=A0A409X0L8_PSICY|nr:hypothetical protein CVT25_013026 [Psilocybe cyanescens]